MISLLTCGLPSVAVKALAAVGRVGQGVLAAVLLVTTLVLNLHIS